MQVDAQPYHRLHIPLDAGTLPPSWCWSRLDSICLGIYDCPHSTPQLTDIGPLVARSQDVRTGMLRVGEAGHVSDETYRERIARAEPSYGDLLYSREGTYFGIAAEVPRDTQVCLGQRMVLLRPDPAVLDFRYLRYWLNSPVVNRHLAGYRDGSVAERLNLPTIRGIPIALPPLSEQRAIARILGALDDKTELNQRMNETLEAIAQALFKSWFIDLDPVHAKAEGQPPVGMDAETATLFPDSFDESVLGLIPHGWQVAKVSTVLSLSREGLNPGNWPEEMFDHYSIPAYDEDRLPKAEAGALIKSNKSVVTPDSVLISKLNPHIPRVWLPEITERRRSVCSTEFLVVRPVNAMTRVYLYALLSSNAFLEVFGTLVTGTSGSHQRVQPEGLLNLEILVPSGELIARFTAIAASLYMRATHNLQESHTLSDTRDTLLPKLLAGYVRGQGAEEAVEAALA